jgi:hypothetical protein
MPAFTAQDVVDEVMTDIAESFHDLNDGDGPFAGFSDVQTAEVVTHDLSGVEAGPEALKVFPQHGDYGVVILVAAIRRDIRRDT